MPWKQCSDCPEEFQYANGEGWKTQCFDCWRKSKVDAGEWGKRRRTPDFLLPKGGNVVSAEFYEHIDSLIRLCHPDKHGNSDTATRITQWLLEKRSELNG